jgi:hypothetical protein
MEIMSPRYFLLRDGNSTTPEGYRAPGCWPARFLVDAAATIIEKQAAVWATGEL